MGLMGAGKLQESAGVGLLSLVVGYYFGRKGNTDNTGDNNDGER